MADQSCAICLRPSRDRVHDGCRTRLRDQLAALPGMLDRLPYALIPGSGGAGERVSASREAPLPLRLAALTLTAGGSDDARCCFVPRVLVTSTVVEVGGARRTVWHRELVRDGQGRPVMVLADDQAGVLPIGAWLEAWAFDWRTWWGHSTEDVPRRAPEPQQPARYTQQDLARIVLGLGPALAPAARPDDPYAEEWRTRWQPTGLVGAADRHHDYLTEWLDAACDEYPHIADFAASLRALTGAALAALGDTSDLQYIGRCPEMVPDRITGEELPCGAAIWHDPYTSAIVCPRCHTETGEDRLMWLARRILDVWPLDRRRRYTQTLIGALRLPSCGCGATVRVEWVDVTGRRDTQRYYQIGRVTCPAGCGQTAERMAS